MLRSFVEKHPQDWYQSIASICVPYNMGVHLTAGTTPFEVVLSRRVPDIRLVLLSFKWKMAGSEQKDDFFRRLKSTITEARPSLESTHAHY